jgi:hypothetical protein
MPYYELTANAESILNDNVVDGYLLSHIESFFARIATSPATLTEPAPSPPYRPDRLMANAELDDSTGRTRRVVVLLKRTDDEEGIVITSLTVSGPHYEPPGP